MNILKKCCNIHQKMSVVIWEFVNLKHDNFQKSRLKCQVDLPININNYHRDCPEEFGKDPCSIKQDTCSGTCHICVNVYLPCLDPLGIGPNVIKITLDIITYDAGQNNTN